MVPDEWLMERVARYADEQALGELLDRYSAPLLAFVSRRAGTFVAEDLLQETWIRVVTARERFDPKRRFSTWVFQIANNLCRDRARRREVEGRHRERVEQTQKQILSSGAQPADQQLDVRRRLERLPERLQEVLVLRYYHQLSDREIAEVVGVPTGTVKSRLHAAVKALRREHEDARRGAGTPASGGATDVG